MKKQEFTNFGDGLRTTWYCDQPDCTNSVSTTWLDVAKEIVNTGGESEGWNITKSGKALCRIHK